MIATVHVLSSLLRRSVGATKAQS